MKGSAVLAFDLGTGGCKAALVDDRGEVIAERFHAYPTSYPASGWHEQRPADWWEAVCITSSALLGEFTGSIAAVAISGHSLALVPVDNVGTALLESVPIWSDIRGEDIAERWFANHDESTWYHRTGNGFPRGMYTVFKAAWFAQQHPDEAEHTSYILGSKDWVNAQLTSKMSTDHSYASGSGCYDLRRRRYDDAMIAGLGLPRTWWPAPVASDTVIGHVTSAAAERTGIPVGVPLVSGGVDNSCMALGAGLDREGAAYFSLGSSNWITVTGSEPALDDVLRPFAFAHVVEGLNISALSTFGGGSTLTWLVDLLGGNWDELTRAALASGPGARGVSFAPTLAGGTVAEGGHQVRGAILGLDLAHGPGDLMRAAIEGVALSLSNAAANLLADSNQQLVAVGGGARSELLLQTLADLTGRTIVRPAHEQHCAARGAAALGWLGIGVWETTAQLTAGAEPEFHAIPTTGDGDVHTAMRARFASASQASRQFADQPTIEGTIP